MENKIFMKLIEEKQKINSKINIEIKSIHRRENMTECTLIEKRLNYGKKKIQEVGIGDPTYLQSEKI